MKVMKSCAIVHCFCEGPAVDQALEHDEEQPVQFAAALALSKILRLEEPPVVGLVVPGRARNAFMGGAY